jgi:hypothetical protein
MGEAAEAAVIRRSEDVLTSARIAVLEARKRRNNPEHGSIAGNGKDMVSRWCVALEDVPQTATGDSIRIVWT